MKKTIILSALLISFLIQPATLAQELSFASIERVYLFPEQYAGKTIYFLGKLSGIERYEGIFSLNIWSMEGKYISPILKREGITFIVSTDMASLLADISSGAQYYVRLGCEIERMNCDRSYCWVAKTFEIGFYDTAGNTNRLVTDDANLSLLSASKFGDKYAVGFAIKCGAQINTLDRKGMTSLMHAASLGHEKTVKLLIEKGADISLKDQANKTALMYAMENNKKDIVKILQKAGARE